MEVQPVISLRDVFSMVGSLNLALLFILAVAGLVAFGMALRLRGERRKACGSLLITLALSGGIYGALSWAFTLSEEYQRRSAGGNSFYNSDVLIAQPSGLWTFAAFSLLAIGLLVGAFLVQLIEFLSLQKSS